MLQLQLSWI